MYFKYNIYNVKAVPTSSSITFEKKGNIIPFVRFYDSIGEEVYWDYQLIDNPNNNKQYQISDIPSIVAVVLIK